MGVDGDVAFGVCDGLEGHFGRLDGIGGAEEEAQAVDVGWWVERVVEDADVHCPFAEIRRGDECDAGGEVALDLCVEKCVSWVCWQYSTGGIDVVCSTFESSFCSLLLLMPAIMTWYGVRKFANSVSLGKHG